MNLVTLRIFIIILHFSLSWFFSLRFLRLQFRNKSENIIGNEFGDHEHSQIDTHIAFFDKFISQTPPPDASNFKTTRRLEESKNRYT